MAPAKPIALWDTVPYPWHEKAGQDLHVKLTDAYSATATATSIAQMAGVHLGGWNKDQALDLIWRDLLDVATRQRRLRRLIETILSDAHVAAYHEDIRRLAQSYVSQQAVSSPATTAMRNALLDALLKLTPEQFSIVVYRSGIRRALLSAASVPQASRAVELLNYFEHQVSALDSLMQITNAVLAPTGDVVRADGSDLDSAVAYRSTDEDARQAFSHTPEELIAKETDRLADMIARNAPPDEIRTARHNIRTLRRKTLGGREPQQDEVLSRRYRLIARIGEGGFATVWKAFDKRTTQLVAVKVLHGHHTQDSTRRERFFRGARVMQALRHEHIVGVLETRGEDRGVYYFVMDYLEGGDLYQAVLDRRISWESLCNALLQVGAALAFAHQRGIIHRDVKPQNVLFDASGGARITDFDLARVPNSTLLTRTAPIGTFVYASPEEIASPTLVDARSDIFSWGMTAVFGFSGAELPWEAFRATAKFIDLIRCPLPVRRLLKKCTAWSLEQRFSQMSEACDALRATLRSARKEATARRREQASEPQQPNDLREYNNAKDGTLMVYVSTADYVIGADDLGQQSRPVHKVRLSAFWIGKYPITNAQYGAFVIATNHRQPHYHDDPRLNLPDHPVVGVSWDDADAYCKWAGLRLPSEAQWEAAARGPSGQKFPWGERSPTPELANYGRLYSGTTSVNRFADAAGPFGTVDQCGNVWEWCEDVWDPDAYRRRFADVVDPVTTDGDETRRALRGGCWAFETDCLRAAHRDWFRKRNRGDDVGFRCVLPDPGRPSRKI